MIQRYRPLFGIAALVVGALAPQAQDHDSRPFETRVGFEPLPLDAPPIVAHRSGPATDDLDQLAVHAVGDVQGLRVAEIGAGGGKHLPGLARRVGPDGKLLLTEISPERCDGLRSMAKGGGYDQVEVRLAPKDDVGLEPASVDLALLSDVYPFVLLLDGRNGQDKHGFLTSLYRSIAPGGQVVVTYVTSSELREDDTRQRLYETTLRDFSDYGFELGRRWIVSGPHWPHYVFEFRVSRDGPVAPPRYMGRRIAKTMHWSGGSWLLRAEREREESSKEMLAALGVKPGQALADLGCGNGYHTLELARMTGSQGRVYGIDIQPEMLRALEKRAKEKGITNLTSLLGGILDTKLPPNSCDLILLADVYHELSHPVPTLASLRRALKPGGRIAVLEFRGEDPQVPIKKLHKMRRDQIDLEFEANGFRRSGSYDELPWQHLCFYEVAKKP